jgi:(2R)-sulfolactate sulfo-lyase subunit alpha
MVNQNKEQTVEMIQAPEAAPQFLIHNEGDHVGVAVQDVEPGERRAVYMDSDRAITITVKEAIPLGHKVALVDLDEGRDVIEYQVRVGLAREPIAAGQHVHIHNIRSARWQNSR